MIFKLLLTGAYDGAVIKVLDDVDGAVHLVGPPAHDQDIGAGQLRNADRAVGRLLRTIRNVQQLVEDGQHFLGPDNLQFDLLQPDLFPFDAVDEIANQAEPPRRIRDL